MASQMVFKMGASALKNAVDEQQSNIEWEDYNYPPGLKIIHFKPSELEDAGKITVAHALHIAFICIPVFFLVNLTLNLLSLFYDIPGASFYEALYSAFHLLMGVPIALGVFSKGYRSLAGISDERTWYKFGEIFMLVFSGCAFSFHMLCYHGLRNVINYKNLHTFIFILGIIEEVLLAVQFGFRLYALIMILTKYQPAKEED
jgi:hypothetical protein